MDKYPLAKLVQWSGPSGITGRKRLQKTVFFLQKAGCPFGAEYLLHQYGPYSRDLAEACDELVSAGVLDERSESTGVGIQYVYKLCKFGNLAVQKTEERQSARASEIAKFKACADELTKKDTRDLELGSTILFFHDKALDWSDAVRQACTFKRVSNVEEPCVIAAEALAKRVAAMAGGAC